MANKKRRCSQCKSYKIADDGIVIHNTFFCDIDCATAKAFAGKDKVADKKHRAKKKAFNDNDKALRNKSAQSSFNAWIRARDKGLPCLSCKGVVNFNSHIGGSGVNAGHYKSRGSSPELRFNEFNVHVQCYRCNAQLSGNIENYRINLIKKIGLDKVEWLEGKHEPKKYTCAELKAIELKYKNKLKEMVE